MLRFCFHCCAKVDFPRPSKYEKLRDQTKIVIAIAEYMGSMELFEFGTHGRE